MITFAAFAPVALWGFLGPIARLKVAVAVLLLLEAFKL